MKTFFLILHYRFMVFKTLIRNEFIDYEVMVNPESPLFTFETGKNMENELKYWRNKLIDIHKGDTRARLKYIQ